MLHGAAVEYKGLACLFLDPSNIEKTLCAYLINIGFGYITEDCILLGRENLFVYACMTPLHIWDGKMNALKNIM